MDWLTFKFCVLIWMLCVSKSQSQLPNSTSTDQLQPACLEGRPVFPPNPCNTCICFSGQVYCTKHPCPEKECINGIELPKPDECNKCICRRGKVVCTNMICIPAPLCTENQLYPAQNKCNGCMCKDGFIRCTSNVCVEEPMNTTTTTTKPTKKKKCVEGSRLPASDQCLDCICQNGRKRCKNVCNPIVEGRFQATTTKPKKKKKKCEEGSRLPAPSQCLDCICQNGKRRCEFICKPIVKSRLRGPECYPGQQITRPDDCNNCICFEGQIHCTNLPCHIDIRTGLQCTDEQSFNRLGECNECYCIEGRLECSDLVCIRGSKCVVGQVIPKPDSCNSCKCVEGHIMCTNHPCSINLINALLTEPSPTEVMPLEECQKGDYIPPPPPPNDCNTCYCMDNHIVCTMVNCEGTIAEFKGRLKEENEKTNLEKFDKKIPVEPFINILYKNNDKIPHKLIHSHTYNGFHQEIKVHASHLLKDPKKLLNVLANSLDNAALASISQKLLTSNSVSSNQDSKKPFDHSVDQTNQLDEGNVLSAQSSKLITSGSQSNETILVFPHKKPFDDQDSQSLLPFVSKHETAWKIVSAPDTLVYNNGIQILALHSQEENGNHYYDNLPSSITPIDPNSTIITRNPAKFGHPGQHYGWSTKSVRESTDTPSIPTQSIYPTLHPNPINIIDGKMIYSLFSQKNKQIKPTPSSFAANRDELLHLRPFQPTKPGPNHIYDHNSPTPGRPEQYELNPDNIVGQQKPSQYHFTANPSNFHPNQDTPQQFQFKPIRVPSQPAYYYNNKGVLVPAKFLNKPNQPIASVNQYKQLQFELKPAPASAYPNNIFINPSQNKVKPKHKQPNSPQPQLILNPSIYYNNEYETPKIIEENPDKDQLTPNSIIFYKHTEDYDPLHTPSESSFEKLPHKVRNKTKRYNTTHSLYEKHTSVAYVPEYDPNDPDDSTPVHHDLNEQHNGPLKYAYLSDEDSQEFDLNEKVNHYLNIPYLQLDQKELHSKSIQSYSTPPGQRQNDTLYLTMPEINKYDQHDSWNITNKQFEEYPLSLSKNKQTDIKTNERETQSVLPINFAIYLHEHFKPKLVSPQDNSEKEDYEDRIHQKSNDHQPPPSQQPKNNLHIPPSYEDEDGFQYAHKANEDQRELKPFYNFPSFLPVPTPNKQTPVMFDDRGSPYGFRHPSYLAENTIHSRENLHNFPPNQFGPDKKRLPGVFDDHGSADDFHYPSESADIFVFPKDKQNDIFIKYGPTENLLVPWRFDDRGSTSGLQNPPSSTEYSSFPKGNIQNLPHSKLNPNQNQRLPGVFDGRGKLYIINYKSTDGFHNPIKSAKLPFQIKYNNPYKPQNSPFTPTKKQKLPGISDDEGFADGFHYPTNSTQKPNYNLYKTPDSPFRPTQNQHLPEDDRGSDNSLHYPSNLAKTPFYPKNNIYKPSNSLVRPTQKLNQPGVFADGIQYPSDSSEDPKHSKENIQESPNFPFGPILNKPTQGKFGDRGSMGCPKYPFNSAEDFKHSKVKSPHSPLGPTKHLPGIFDERGSADIFQYPSYAAENPLQPKGNQLNPSLPQLSPNQNQHMPVVFDDRESADGFQYPSDSAENPLQPKGNQQNPSHPQFGPNQNQHMPGVFDDRGSADGFQYPSDSAENPLLPKGNQQNPSLPQLGSNQNQHMPGLFDDRGSADGFQFPSDSAENPLLPKGNQQNPLHPQLGPNQNQNMPGLFDDRGSADGFQNSSDFAENPLLPKGNEQNPSHPLLGPNQNQHKTGVFDDRGSADGFQYPSDSAENPLLPKGNQQNPSLPQLSPNQNQHMPGLFDDRGSADGFQYPSDSAENPLLPKGNQQNPSHPQLGPNQNQHIPGLFDDRGSADGFQYPSNSAENPLLPKGNEQNPSHPQLSPNQNQHMPGVFDDRGSDDGFQYPSDSAENPLLPKGNQQNSSLPQLGPNQNQHMPGVFDDRGSADGFQYPSDSAENPLLPKGNEQNPSHPQLGPNQYQHMPGVFDDRGSADGFHYPSHAADNPLLTKGNQQNPSLPQLGPNQNQHMPGVFDDRPSRFEPDYDQYKLSSFDNLFNGIHHMPRPVPNQDNNAIGFNAKLTTPHFEFKPQQDQYRNIDLFDEEDDHLQKEIDNSTDLINSESMQNNSNHRIKPDNVLDSLLPNDDGNFPDYYDQLYPLFIALKKLSEPSNDDLGLSSMDKLDLLPILFPEIADILNYNPSLEQDDEAPVENQVIQSLFPLKKLESKLNQLTDNDNRILNWLKSKLKLFPTKDNTTETKKEIDLPKIFSLLSKLTSNNLKKPTENITFNGFDAEIVEKIMNDFKEDPLTVTPIPRSAETTNDNRFQSIPIVLEESQQQDTKTYPEVHIILNQPDDEDNVDLPPYTEADGEAGLATDMGSKEVHSLLFPNMLYPRFKNRPKDQKEECGHRTHWISNCHSCFCYFGQTMCLRMQDCKLRPFGEPMICKPYSHFKMGCYTCECNGDGVTECDATDCGKEPKGTRQVSGSRELALPIYHEFFDDKKTNEILQYYNFYKKLTQDCLRQNSQIEYPTCERGTSWISSCHKCECNERGKHECAKINDCVLNFDSYGKPGRCKPNTKFYPKTNSMPCVECLCNDEGIPFCPEADVKKH